jgi:hypothetical protein
MYMVMRSSPAGVLAGTRPSAAWKWRCATRSASRLSARAASAPSLQRRGSRREPGDQWAGRHQAVCELAAQAVAPCVHRHARKRGGLINANNCQPRHPRPGGASPAHRGDVCTRVALRGCRQRPQVHVSCQGRPAQVHLEDGTPAGVGVGLGWVGGFQAGRGDSRRNEGGSAGGGGGGVSASAGRNGRSTR